MLREAPASCPEATTTLDYAASTIVVPDDVGLMNQLELTGSILVTTPYIDVTGNGDYEERTVTYDLVCVPKPTWKLVDLLLEAGEILVSHFTWEVKTGAGDKGKANILVDVWSYGSRFDSSLH